MLVFLFTRKSTELSLGLAFGLLAICQSPLRDSVGFSPTSPVHARIMDAPET